MVQETELRVTYECPADIIYKALTDQTQLCQFTQSPCISEPHVGGKHQIFGDKIQATYVELVPNRLLRMKWKFSEWGDNFADLRMEFSEGSTCDIVLRVTNIPESDKFGSNVHIENIN